ncbi:hypothetical protein, conserved [Eimeria maxima]|uniref:Uncharacterized protein n=1 Tax=Eimeria maxima TaxID=5804 RepID=U6M0N4_EIMMA|nr:hypothetical protein, conserved [Eimeria maxima]CDJ56643.1 hypothetical protein, conserved [Eimeria maxima]
MDYYVREERAPECSLFDVPLIGPKRDFATEVEFRLANAAKMYPAGYTDPSRYAYRAPVQYGTLPPAYWEYRPPMTVNYPHEAMTEPLGYYSSPVQPSPHPQRWAYYEPRNCKRPRPVVPHADMAFPGPFSGTWQSTLGGVPQPPMQATTAVPSQLGMPVETWGQPQLSPRIDAVAPSVWQTVEVVGVLPFSGQEKNPGQSQEKETVTGASNASQNEPNNESPGAVKEVKVAQRAPAAKRKPAGAKKGQRGHAQPQQPEGDEAVRDDMAPELTKGSALDKYASANSIGSEQPADETEPTGQAERAREPPVQDEQREDAVANEKGASYKLQPTVVQNQQHKVEAFSICDQANVQQKGGEASLEGAFAAKEKQCKLNSGIQSQFGVANAKGEKPEAIAFFSVGVSAPSVGSSLGPMSPLSQKSPGYFGDSLVGRADASAGATSSWPIGYVPPPDDKYKELVVGGQVYLEGGTFYLSETGAYLLGLRG